MKSINVVISITDKKCAFDDFFDDDEADNMIKFAKSLGYNVKKDITSDRFANYPKILRTKVVHDIDWGNYKTILYIIKNPELTAEQIIAHFNSNQTNLGVRLHRELIFQQILNWKKIDGEYLTEEKMVEYAKKIALSFSKGNISKWKKAKKRLIEKGCSVGTSKMPECKDGFHDDCKKCAINYMAGKPIKTDDDIFAINHATK